MTTAVLVFPASASDECLGDIGRCHLQAQEVAGHVLPLAAPARPSPLDNHGLGEKGGPDAVGCTTAAALVHLLMAKDERRLLKLQAQGHGWEPHKVPLRANSNRCHERFVGRAPESH